MMNFRFQDTYSYTNYNSYTKVEVEKLYNLVNDFQECEETFDQDAIGMITMVNQATKPQEFQDKWKKNPQYKLTMRGPISALHSSALHGAIKYNNIALVKYLAQKLFCNVDFKDSQGITPLQHAISCRKTIKSDLEIVRILLECGADVNCQLNTTRVINRQNIAHSYLSISLENSDLELTNLLMLYGARRLTALRKDRKCLIKQELKEQEIKIYRELKNKFKMVERAAFQFLLGFKDKNSLIKSLPKELIIEIFSNLELRRKSPLDQKIKAAKMEIKAAEEWENRYKFFNIDFNLSFVSHGRFIPSIYFAEESIAVDIIEEIAKEIAYNDSKVEIAANKKTGHRWFEEGHRLLEGWYSNQDEIVTKVTSSFKGYIDYQAFQKAEKWIKQMIIKEIARAIQQNIMRDIQVDIETSEFNDVAEIKVNFKHIDQQDIDNAFESLNDNPAMKNYLWDRPLVSTLEL